uniref:TIR domain-containing protein n=1 Tax=Brassica campestris TaxID=3711 RepID=M4E4E5_BRACM
MDSSSSSSSSTRHYNYDVFPSFSGQDVRRTFLSHFLEALKSKGIKTFIDNGIIRSESINSELIRAIRESRIAVVILSKNYASSSWCLNELQLIMECTVSLGQTVMTVFYDVEPSDVRKQTGDFGKAFKETCYRKTEEEKKKWSEALSQVAVIAGEHSVSWAGEAEMISKIVMDVSNELPSTDFDQLVGVEAHLEKMRSVICLDSDEVKIVGIWGPDGIGKSTIVRALYNNISSNFQLKFYRERGPTNSMGLLSEVLSGMLDHRDMKILDLQDAQYRLTRQRVLLVLDDVASQHLQVLQNLFRSLLFGSKVIVVNKDIETFTHNGIEQIYKVPYPSSEEALQIFSYSAFGQSSPPRGYFKHAVEVSKLIAPFPLGLKVLGSALRGKSEEEWTTAPAKLRAYLGDKDIEKTIRFAVDGLSEKHKNLYFSLTSASNRGKNLKDSIYLLAKGDDWDVEKEIQTLADMALIYISSEGEIMMHDLHENIFDGSNIITDEIGSGHAILNPIFSTLDPGKSAWGSIYDNCTWICYKTVDIKYGQYSCKDEDCSYILHSKCATHVMVWDGKELEWEPEEVVTEDIAPFKNVGDGLIEHFGHEHHLKLEKYDSIRDAKKQCQACVLPIVLHDFYNCIQCDYFLHSVCAGLPRKLDHALHNHSIFLDPFPPPNDSDFNHLQCSACSRTSSGFKYKCYEKDCKIHWFKIDVTCCLVPEYSTQKFHEHPIFIAPYNYDHEIYPCNGCKRRLTKTRLQCTLCEISICYECATIPEELHYKHDEHPLTLCYGEETDGKYWCEECEKEVNPSEWFYTCNKCCITIHRTCLFGFYVYLKPGHTLKYNRATTVEVLGNSISTRPICSRCEERCRGFTYFKVDLKTLCSWCVFAPPKR